MCKIGLIDYMRQSGTVNLHGQNTFSDKRYNELQSAGKMIKNYLKGSDLKVDMYDINSVPEDKFVYFKVPDGVYVEVTNLLDDVVYPQEFIDRHDKEPVIRQIFRFIEKINTADVSPIDRMMSITRARYSNYLRNVNK